MNKKLVFILFFILSFVKAFTQDISSDKNIYSLYTAAPQAGKAADTASYFLIKFKKPEAVNRKKLRLVKRVSYNFYIVEAAALPGIDDNITNISPANSLWKASDNLIALWQKHPKSGSAIKIKLVTVNNYSTNQLNTYGTIGEKTGNNITLLTSWDKLPAILADHQILFADVVRKAHDELAITDIDLGANNIAAIADNYPGLDGTGINVCIKENLYDNDLDILGRTFVSFLASDVLSGHATTMATLIGGNGNSYIQGIGAAPQTKFTSSTFAQLSADNTSTFEQYKISVQNHSYGTDIENYYSDESASYDRQMLDDDTLVHVFSAGNIGTTAPTTGVYSGITAANITGTFKQAKNVIIVGGTERNNVPATLSSFGPSYDGRIIPQIVADGEDGTSGSAALTSGSVVLLQQAYKKLYNHLPSSALIKSVLINAADNLVTNAVSYKTGYGKLNALAALRTINESRFVTGTVTNDAQMDFTISVPVNSSNFKATLVWNDLPATVNAPASLINDLDLSVSAPNGSIILPWALSAFPSKDSLNAPAKRRRDTVNNTEQVTLTNPASGNYIIHVKGAKIPAGKQSFYVAYNAISADKFEWIYPAGPDHLFAADSTYIRWQNTFNVSSAPVSISYDHGVNWQPIATVNPKKNIDEVFIPDIFTQAMLKMDIGGQPQVSKEFVISKPLSLQVGYNCTSGTLLHWSPQQGATGYAVYNIKDNLLQKLTTTTDTSIIIPADQQSSVYFAVSALGNGFEGIKSYTLNVTDQGVGCYIRSLLANVKGKTIVLNLSLGSVVNLKSITWEKETSSNTFTPLGTTNITGNNLSYQFTDKQPKAGIQYYRAKLTTTTGDVIYTDLASATYLLASQFYLYPNPVGSELNILSPDLSTYNIKLYNTIGKLSFDSSFNQLNNVIGINIQPGIYIYVIYQDGKALFKGKLIKN